MNLNTKFFLWYNQPKHYGKLKSFNIFNSIPSLLINMEKLESVRSGSMHFNLLDSIPTSKSTKQYQKRLSQSKSAYLATQKSIREFKFDKLIGLCKFLHVFVWSATKRMVSSPNLADGKINLLPIIMLKYDDCCKEIQNKRNNFSYMWFLRCTVVSST